MLEQAFHTLTNIDFFYSGDSFTQVEAAIYGVKLHCVGVWGPLSV